MNENLRLRLYAWFSFLIIKHVSFCSFVTSRKQVYDDFENQWKDLKVKLENDQKDCDQLLATLLPEDGADETNNM